MNWFLQADNMRDFVDKYISEIKSSNNKESSFHGEEGILNLANVLIDFFLAGSETTSTTLNWGMLYMIMNPNIQAKASEMVFTEMYLPSGIVLFSGARGARWCNWKGQASNSF